MGRFNIAYERMQRDMDALQDAWRDEHDVAASAVANPAPREERPTMMQAIAVFLLLSVAGLGLALFAFFHTL